MRLSTESTRLLLIRHAHADAGTRLCGSLDVPLSATGRAQVGALLQRPPLQATPVALYSSDLRRAREVADACAAAWRLAHTLTPSVREIHCGSLEGIGLDELQRLHPDLWARNLAQRDEDFAWPGGESYSAFRRRVLGALGEIASTHRGERVAVVTHAGVISQVVGSIRRRTAAVWDADRPDPLTATEIAWLDGGPCTVLTFNNPHWY